MPHPSSLVAPATPLLSRSTSPQKALPIRAVEETIVDEYQDGLRLDRTPERTSSAWSTTRSSRLAATLSSDTHRTDLERFERERLRLLHFQGVPGARTDVA
ncbi:hypothetical protein [Rathayibacter tanaceti]|uniref:Uncharacterized protein n=2 Tax=Rathayibacter tanaceti TaxID=1671680 RepID=A0A166IFS9_9MICO|nr:hypothetical protein [Rathayibacter tanaceti]KZX22313.1 hypothetical protein ACH61_00554 [Rathayibacter tanaceti]QHC56138.1 hypothetical protein GSU10_11170 [Rathayibacter tanaceti]TCO36975.1 hypothetical protein EV639_10558 [Rathayibacter tanaceti]